jgi:hypothetical protein
VDESDPLTLVNAGDAEVVSQEEGERAGGVSHTCGHTGRARTVLDWVVLL